jgi:hypothetical protein
MTSVNPGDHGSATSTAGAATVHHTGGTITTEALTTAAGADYSFTLTCNNVLDGSAPLFSVGNGSNTTVPYYVHSVQVTAGQVTFKIRNAHATVALNGTLVIYFAIL